MTALDTVANIDILAILSLDTDVSVLYPILVQSVLHYLDLFEESLKTLERTAQEVIFETFHFLPEDLSHFITVLYLKSQAENLLSKFKFHIFLFYIKICIKNTRKLFKYYEKYL